MRAKCWLAIVAVATLALTGCRSGSSGWSWNRKSNAEFAKSEPALPSAGANADAAPAFAGTATPPGVASPSAFSAPNAYAGAPYPDTTASHTAAASGPESGAVADASSLQQQGSYADAYGATPTAYPSTGAPPAYPQAEPPAQTAMNPYNAADPYGGVAAGAAPPADQYGAYGAAAGAATSPYDMAQGQAADPAASYAVNHYSQAGPSPGGTQPEQSAAQHYGVQQSVDPYGTGVPATSPMMADAAQTPVAPSGYQPGSTSYAPGDTGYQPPGVPRYEMPAEPNVVANRPDPHYRPGGTGDYISPAQQPAATVADRYSNPTSQYSHETQYLKRDGSDSPSKGYVQ